MTQKELDKAVMAMQSIILMARSPLVTRRGRVIIDQFVADNGPKPKEKKEKTDK